MLEQIQQDTKKSAIPYMVKLLNDEDEEKCSILKEYQLYFEIKNCLKMFNDRYGEKCSTQKNEKSYLIVPFILTCASEL